MLAQIHDVFPWNGGLYTYHLYIPDYYTPLFAMKGIVLLQDHAREEEEVLPWLAKMHEEECILLRIDPPEAGWRAEDAEAVNMLVGWQITWNKGGYAILGAYKYFISEGASGIAAAPILTENANMYAAAALWNAGAAVDGEALNIPILTQNEGFPFSLDECWAFLSGYRRVPITPTYGQVLPVRDMSHVIRRREIINGVLRTFYIAEPFDIGDEPLPVVFGLHGVTSNGLKYMEQTELDVLADKYRFLAVTPTGYLNRWNASHSPDFPDDAAFFDEVIGLLSEDYPIDRSRIYLLGFSMGSAMSERALLDRPFTYAAAASFSGHIIEPGETLTMLRQPESRGQEIYDSTRSDIPLRLVQIYGECEPPTAFPGNIGKATEFWKKVYGCEDKDPGEIFPIDDRLVAKEYKGVFGSFISILEKGLTHTYYTDLCEWVWKNVFSKCTRPENSIASAAAKDGTLSWTLDGAEPDLIVVTTEDGCPAPLRIAGEERSAGLPEAFFGKKLLMIPVYGGNAASAPVIVQG